MSRISYHIQKREKAQNTLYREHTEETLDISESHPSQNQLLTSSKELPRKSNSKFTV